MLAQALQRLVQGQHVVVADVLAVHTAGVHVGQGDVDRAAAALGRQAGPGVVHQHSAHLQRHQGEEVGAVGVADIAAEHAQQRLVHQRGGPEGDVLAVAPEAGHGHVAQHRIDRVEQRFPRLQVAGPPGVQQAGDVVGRALFPHRHGADGTRGL